jgi:iron complex transport system substrate-binding protein
MIIIFNKGDLRLVSHRQSKYGSRNLAFLVSTLLLLALTVSACGSGKSNNGNPTETAPASSQAASAQPEASAESSSPASTATSETQTVSTVKGDIAIPVQPQRIVAEEYLGSLIALDVIPVGAPGLTLENYYFKEALTGVQDTGTYGEPNAEKILALQPDLIITGNGDSYEQLSKVAPTLFIPYGDLKNAHEELTYFGKLLGKEDKAAEWLAEYDRRIAEAKAKVDAAIPAEASFSILEDGGKKTWAYGNNFGRGGQPVYQALGRKPPAAVAAEIMEKQWAEISAEVVEQYAGDYIIMTSNNRTVEDFEADPVWGSLPAVKNGHLYVWPEARSWYYDPLAVLAQTEELAEWLSNPDN